MRLCVFCAAAIAAAAFAAPVHADDEWRATPYLWLAGFDGTVGADSASGDGGADVDFGHLWDNLRLGGAMLNVGWRRDRWSAAGDWTYARVTSESPTRVPNVYATAEGEVKGHVLQAVAGYDLLDRDDAHLDLFAGARYFDIEVSFDLSGGALPAASFEGSDQWLDAIAGLRAVGDFADHWQASATLDAGAGGSDLSWQAIGSIAYAFGWGSIIGGYRHLKVDYDSGSLRLDAALSGPFLGASFKF